MPETLMTELSPAELAAAGVPPGLSLGDRIPGARKAAIFLVALGEDMASEIFRHLEEDEVQLISKELAALERVPSDITDFIVEEFHQLLLAQTYVATGGVDYAKRLLIKAYGPEIAKRLLDKITRSLETT